MNIEFTVKIEEGFCYRILYVQVERRIFIEKKGKHFPEMQKTIKHWKKK